MSQYVESATKMFTAGAAIAQYARVKFSSGKVVEAGLTDRELGTAEQQAFASGDIIAVRLRTAQGTCKMIAIEVLSQGALLYTEASGKVQDTVQATSFLVGTALEAATANGDIIEVLRNTHGDTAVP